MVESLVELMVDLMVKRRVKSRRIARASPAGPRPAPGTRSAARVK
jgi:hypothetical protein